MTKYLLILLLLIVPVSAYAYNSGFTPIYQPNLPSSGAINNTLSSIGHAESIVSGQVLNDHQFKGIGCGGDIVCSSNGTDVTISYTDGLGTGEANTASSDGLGYSLVLPKSGVDLPFRGIFCAGDLLCSSNDTDVRISYIDTPGGSGNATSLDNLGDVVLTSVSQFSMIYYNGVQWLDQIFKSNSLTCSAGQFFSAFNNQTGDYTCSSPTGSGFTTIASSPQTTATVLASNSSNTAVIKTLTQGQGITLTNGSQAVTVATNFKTNTITCGSTDKFSAYDNSTGLFTCSADQTGAGTARESSVAIWTVDATKTNIGTAYVNVYTTGQGDPLRIDTNGKTTATLVIDWTKIGAGTQKCQIVSTTSANIVLITFNNLATGINTNATVTIPTNAQNLIDTFKPQCFSTTAADDPVWLTGHVLLR